MTPMLFIRTEVFRTTQAAMAAIAGVGQSTVSKWERAELEPGRSEMQRIREEALRRDMKWRDEWFFRTPAAAARPAPPLTEAAGAAA